MNASECAEQRFALEQNIDPARLKRREKKEPYGPYSCDLYRIDAGKAYSPEDMINVITKITHLKLEQILRFSNSMMALSNMFALARHHGISGIILPHHWYLHVGEYQVEGVRFVHLPPAKSYEIRENDLILSGNFFYKDSLKKCKSSPCPKRFVG